MIAGLGLFVLGIRIFGRSYSSTRWPIAPGRVVRSDVKDGSAGNYTAVVEYEFILGGRVYRGRGIPFPVNALSTEQT
jgi:Protein of unknown function (DUF3592)